MPKATITANRIQRLTLVGGLTLLAGVWVTSPAAQAEWIVDAQTIEAHVKTHVENALSTLKLNDADTQVVLDVVKVPRAPFTFSNAQQADDITITVESPLAQQYSDRTVVRVAITSRAGDTPQHFGVPVRIQVKKPVWVVKNPVQAKQKLMPQDLTLQMRDVSHQCQHAVGANQDLTDTVARVNLLPGAILDNRQLTQPPEVSRNEMVQVVLTNGQDMTIQVSGTALTDARLGQSVRVKNNINSTRRYFTATVIGKNKVQVDI